MEDRVLTEEDYTNGIPICPVCNVTTKRESLGGTSTLLGFSRVYDENGIETTVDPNTKTLYYRCSCQHRYLIRGREKDGYRYG